MDAKFITAFLEATESVINTMAFIKPQPGRPYLKKDSMAQGDVSAVIGMTGSVQGSLAISFSGSCILKIVSNMLGEELTDITSDIKDAVGEITNMVSGVARQKLEANGYSVAAAIPTVVSGINHRIIHVLGGPSIIIPFETDSGPFVIDICISES
ncbi:MAG: chemotaxis protein CheX [Syntrophales bacterium]|nr:chemotaxis protein CheX [Syntrophales bacterium]